MHVEQYAFRDERLMDLTQGVHDALRLDSSQGPAEKRDLERGSLRQVLGGADLESNAFGELGRRRGSRRGDLLLFGIDSENAPGPRRVQPREPAVSTADLEHIRAVEVAA
jgi:hypothetical protein